MNAVVTDPDFTLYQGDALETLRELPAESVDCVVTSPPYWGLRDYGTGDWDGGDPDCDHREPAERIGGVNASGLAGWDNTLDATQIDAKREARRQQYRDVCEHCGAVRVDRQLGLEATPEEYVARMVELFAEVRRVLAPHGTVWLNLGDTYASAPPGNVDGVSAKSNLHGAEAGAGRKYRETLKAGHATKRNTVVGHLKPKDLVGIPWRLALALQADGWYLRSDIIWAKPNPMPSSVTDRPTTAHEYVFLLAKRARYFYDADAIREPAEWARWGDQTNAKHEGSGSAASWIGTKSKEELQRKYANPGNRTTNGPRSTERRHETAGFDQRLVSADGHRNKRTVWEIATEPYPEAHFATFPQALVEPCIKAGTSEHGRCPTCGAPWQRETERKVVNAQATNTSNPASPHGLEANRTHPRASLEVTTIGWRETCACNPHKQPVPCVVLDPFMGSGTTALVARRLGRRSIGVELSPDYCRLAARRLAQLSLFAEPDAATVNEGGAP